MTQHFRAVQDSRLQARITGSRAMVYAEGASAEEDRPPHVRAASGLSAFLEHLAVIQDDANWLALIDADQKVTAIPLPPSPNGDRVFSRSRGNRCDKYDLEACITVASDSGPELLGFSSGSRAGREWVLRVRDAGEAPPDLNGDGGRALADRLNAEFVDAVPFYRSMRENRDFSGAGLNIEGALTVGHDTIRLFQRGNAAPKDGFPAIDATAELSWTDLCRHLADRHASPPPLRNIRTYDLGELDGVRLTFSDAEYLGDERVLFSASAEDRDTGEIKGSVLGLIGADGSASWTELVDENGRPFGGKIEGLTLDLHDPRTIHFVIDDDDEDAASRIFDALLSEHFLRSDTARVSGAP